MKTFRVVAAAALSVAAAAALLTGTASAAPVVVGSPLTANFPPSSPFPTESTIANTILTEPGAQLTSPVNGAVIRWHLLGATGDGYKLRVLRPAAGEDTFSGAGTSAPVAIFGPGLETFTTALPIRAGDTIGLDVPGGDEVGSAPSPSTSFALWVGGLGEESPQKGAVQTGFEVGFNAEVQPQPTVTRIGATSGPLGGGTTVTITGTEFASVSGVKFSGAPATFLVNSEGQLTAVSPPGSAGTVDVTVTTVAGTSPATSADRFTYESAAPTIVAPSRAPAAAPACAVPKLVGKKLKAAKKKLKAAACKVGKVKRKNGVTATTGKVVAQGKKAGKSLPAGTKVSVTLGQP